MEAAPSRECSGKLGKEFQAIKQSGDHIPVDSLIKHRFAEAQWNVFARVVSAPSTSGSDTRCWPDAVSRFASTQPAKPVLIMMQPQPGVSSHASKELNLLKNNYLWSSPLEHRLTFLGKRALRFARVLGV